MPSSSTPAKARRRSSRPRWPSSPLTARNNCAAATASPETYRALLDSLGSAPDDGEFPGNDSIRVEAPTGEPPDDDT